jgi:hypothetical protein
MSVKMTKNPSDVIFEIFMELVTQLQEDVNRFMTEVQKLPELGEKLAKGEIQVEPIDPMVNIDEFEEKYKFVSASTLQKIFPFKGQDFVAGTPYTIVRYFVDNKDTHVRIYNSMMRYAGLIPDLQMLVFQCHNP